MSLRSRYGLAFIAFLVLSTSVGIAAAGMPGATEDALLLLAGVAACIVARKWLPEPSRLALAGLVIGTGSLAYVILGGLSSGLLAVSLAAALPTPRTKSIRLYIAWLAAVTLVFAGLIFTMSHAHVPKSMTLTVACVVVASAWVLLDRSAAASAAKILWWAGIASATGVFVSLALGHPVFPNSGTSAASGNSGPSRAAGFGDAPNQTALVLCAALIAASVGYVGNRRKQRAGDLGKFAVYAAAIGTALLLTGSRSATLGAAAAFIIAGTSMLIRRPWRAFLAAVVIAAGAATVGRLGAFQGRSLDVLSSDDGSSIYRRAVQARLWSEIDIHQLSGFGFLNGNLIAPNPLTNDVSNVDNAWLYSILCFGTVLTAGILLILLLQLIRALPAGALALAPVPWIILATSAENVWVLAGPAICVVLVLSTVHAATTKELNDAQSTPRVKHEVARHGANQSTSVGLRIKRDARVRRHRLPRESRLESAARSPR